MASVTLQPVLLSVSHNTLKILVTSVILSVSDVAITGHIITLCPEWRLCVIYEGGLYIDRVFSGLNVNLGIKLFGYEQKNRW